MSYDISLYCIETKEKEQASSNEDFFSNEENFVPFSDQQFEELKERLLKYDYKLTKRDDFQLQFINEDEDFGRALLTTSALYFTADWNENSIFEVSMTASEFNDTGEYAKYDFQNGNWETWERHHIAERKSSAKSIIPPLQNRG